MINDDTLQHSNLRNSRIEYNKVDNKVVPNFIVKQPLIPMEATKVYG